jgi:crossover junction endodeoxyribonuclease RusA
VTDEPLPYPPSLNTYWRHPIRGKLVGRTLISEKGRDYRRQIKGIVLARRLPRFDGVRLAVTIKASAPDKRLRDLDNIPKALLDALVHAGVLEDDSMIDELHIIRLPPRAPGTVFLTITPR